MYDKWIRGGLAAPLLTLAARPAAAGEVELLSRVAPGLESATAGGESAVGEGALSADGRYLVFESDAPNLLPGQGGPRSRRNIFLLDRLTDTLTLVSHAAGSPTTGGNGGSIVAIISADGRYVVYLSHATDLVAGQTDVNFDFTGASGLDVFLFDRLSGANTLVSHSAAALTTTGSSESYFPQISSDGRYVAFGSGSTDLVAGQADANDALDVFLFDRDSAAVTLVSHSAGSAATTAESSSLPGGLSGDGRYLLFESNATDLVAGLTDGNAASDVFLFDLVTGTTTLVSHATGAPTTAAGGTSSSATISADGAWIVFASDATDLVAGVTDDNAASDLFLRDRAAGTTVLVSHAAGAAATAANGQSFGARISADGAGIAFLSVATDLVAGQVDTNSATDAFFYQRASGLSTLISHAAGSPATAASGGTNRIAIAAGGGYVAFAGTGTDLVPGQVAGTFGQQNVFLWEQASGTNALASHVPGSPAVAGNAFSGPGGFSTSGLAMTADGAWLAYDSLANNLVANDRNSRTDVFLYERASGANTLVSRHAPGQASSTAVELFFDMPAPQPAVPSADGRFVAFSSTSRSLVPGQVDAQGELDVFLHDHTVEANLLASRAAGTTATTGNDGSGPQDLNADGRFVAFVSDAGNLVPGQVGAGQEIFRFDRLTGTNDLLSRAFGTTATASNGVSGPPSISADGNQVAFASNATNLTSTSPPPCCDFFHVYVYDGGTDEVLLLSRQAGSTAPALGSAHSPRISADGRYVAYLSNGTNLVPGQTGGGLDNVYLTDVVTGATLLVSHASAAPATPSNGTAVSAALSADGRFVAFASNATNVVPGQIDSNAGFGFDVFLYDRLTGTNRLVSGAGGSPTTAGNGSSLGPAVSADGRFVAFTSDADDLVPGMVDRPDFDVFLFDRVAGTLTLVSHASGAPGTAADALSYDPTISADGGAVAYLSRATDLVAGQTGGAESVNVFLYDRLTGSNELASHVPGSETTASTGIADSPRVSADGRRVAFTSTAGDLDEHDFNGLSDTFLYSRALPPGLDFFTLTPCRRLDSRQPGQGPALASDVRRTIAVAGGCGVPATARAVAVNVTVTQPTGAGHLVFSPGDSVASPTASTINFAAGQTRANNAILPLPGGGVGTLNVDPFVLGGGTVHLIVDVVGYFE